MKLQAIVNVILYGIQILHRCQKFNAILQFMKPIFESLFGKKKENIETSAEIKTPDDFRNKMRQLSKVGFFVGAGLFLNDVSEAQNSQSHTDEVEYQKTKEDFNPELEGFDMEKYNDAEAKLVSGYFSKKRVVPFNVEEFPFWKDTDPSLWPKHAIYYHPPLNEEGGIIDKDRLVEFLLPIYPEESVVSEEKPRLKDTMIFEPNTPNVYGVKYYPENKSYFENPSGGQYVYYNSFGDPKVITKQEFDRLKSLEKEEIK